MLIVISGFSGWRPFEIVDRFEMHEVCANEACEGEHAGHCGLTCMEKALIEA